MANEGNKYEQYLASLDDEALNLERANNYQAYQDAENDDIEEYYYSRVEACQAEEGRRRL